MRVLICALACLALSVAACGQDVAVAQRDDASLPTLDQSMAVDPGAPPSPSVDPNAPPLDLRVLKSMIYGYAVKHHLNPYLAMGLGWWESGWNQTAVSSAGSPPSSARSSASLTRLSCSSGLRTGRGLR